MQENIPHDASEKRKDRRIGIPDINMRSEMPLAGIVSVINISSGGLLVKSDRRLNIGNTYLIKIGYKNSILFARVVVKWSFLTESIEDANGNMIPIYTAGMQFKEMISGSGEGLMQALIADLEADANPEHGVRRAGNIQPVPQEQTVGHQTQEAETRSNCLHEDLLHGHGTDSLEMAIRGIEDEYNRISKHSGNYYALLGVRDTASAEEIKKAYICKVKEFHPDGHLTLPHETREKLTDIISHLNNAYSTLINRKQRLHYN